VAELLELAENDPDLSLALLRRIGTAVSRAEAAGDDAALIIFQNAALEAAVNAVGLGSAILRVTSDLGSIEADAMDIVVDAINRMKNLNAVADILGNIFEGFDPDPGEFDNFDPNNLALAAVVLLAAEAKASGDPEGFIVGFTPGDAELAEKMAAVAIANSDASKRLTDVLGNLNLVP
jgi:hypothetical protein